MNPFVTETGVVMPIDRADVDTDQIIPKQFLKKIERTGFAEGLFFDWRGEAGFPLDDPHFAGSTILVTGRNFGCGSSREHAPWALEDYGFRAVIAPSFADIFRSNCTKIGLLPVVLSEADVTELIADAQGEPGAKVTVDLERQLVTLPSGREVAFEIEPSTRHRLLNGLDDIGLTLQRESLISDYERERERTGPVTTLVL